jgi:hypothetical protein
VAADEEAWRRVDAAVVAMPGVARLLRVDRLKSSSPDAEIRAAALSTFPGRSGDLVVVPKPNWTVGPRAEQSATTHGTAQPYDRQVPLILFGAGIKSGRSSATASPADIAPTVAHISGVTMPPVEGRVLKEAFWDPRSNSYCGDTAKIVSVKSRFSVMTGQRSRRFSSRASSTSGAMRLKK